MGPVSLSQCGPKRVTYLLPGRQIQRLLLNVLSSPLLASLGLEQGRLGTITALEVKTRLSRLIETDLAIVSRQHLRVGLEQATQGN
jgi:hypothetical protein